jgi:hypothetical protein
VTGARVWIDQGAGWEEIHGISSVTLHEERPPQQPTPPPPRFIGHPIPYELALDWGLIPPDTPPPPTPVERALAILAPHLANDPLYRPTAPDHSNK